MKMPGCHINITIIEQVLNEVKNNNGDSTLIFLDEPKAYDSIGHVISSKICFRKFRNSNKIKKSSNKFSTRK